ncbi:MAG TPA: helicase C-terminal domain-containing protein, partial [Candidatus Gracilibacteria bacterium]|nr:helicase C-terminal domain-containing protein [Candidatus Gracilibacteria bacterium]
MERIFVALDIETTGFEPGTDQIIEIAAIKFDGTKTLDTFQTLINPERDIPPIITHITGIKGEDLTAAPRLEEVKEKISQFIGSSPIVGHNINFDVTFLNQKGVFLKNELYDTLQLAGILLPGLASYSLDTLTRVLKIEHRDKHRALSDTQATADLFSLLLKKIEAVDQETLFEIGTILDKSTWQLGELFKDHTRLTSLPKRKENLTTESEEEMGTPSGESLSMEEFQNFFSEEGALSKTISDYESRPTQREIAEKIISCFEREKHLLVEAGTGTGKTIAYLAASAFFASENNKKIVVSTYTKNLQDQLMNKDIPLLEKALRQIHSGIRLKVALLKGRRNYLSLKRLERLMAHEIFQDHEVTFLIKVLIWLKTTSTGDLQELNVQGKEFSLLDEVCYDETADVSGTREDNNRSFLKKARRRAEQADIVIVNHSLMMQEAESGSIVPDCDYIIFDEAHHLERVTTESFTINISLTAFSRPCEKIMELRAAKNLAAEVQGLQNRVEIFFGLLGIFMEKFAEESQFQMQYLIKEDSLNSMEWQKISEAARQLHTLKKELVTKGSSLAATLADEDEEKARELKNALFAIENNIENLETVFLGDNLMKRINWVYRTHEGNACFRSAPAQVGEKLRHLFFETKKTVVLTSATLRTDHSFSFIRQQLGIDEMGDRFEEAALPSHFDYPDQVKIIIPEDMPRPNTEGNFLASCGVIADVIKKNGGRTLVLFTSKKALSATYMQIAPRLKKEGFNILAQGMSGGKGKILEHFKEEPEKCALFGTDSFWEGVDMPGDMLTCIIMQKLPFDPPGDPIIFYRCQQYVDSFNEYQLPRAILKFKQGFGRLIRTSRDRGSIILLDSRIIQNSYGRKFLDSLPEGI